METARRAGIRGALVQTGCGGKDDKYQAAPAAVFEDLLGAVGGILKNAGASSSRTRLDMEVEPCS